MGKARKRSHGHGTVFVRPNGRFTAQITNGGDRRSIGTFATRKAAEPALAAALVEGPPTALEMTFREYLTDWLADRPLTVKPTTTARDRNVVTRYVLPHPIARRLVRDLEPKDFRALYRFLAASGKEDGTGLAPGTIKTVEQVLRGALQQLVDDRDLPWHPMPHRAVKTIVTERPHLNTDQLRGLIRFATFRYPDLEVVIRLGGLAGLRRGEICGLRWSDVDFGQGTAIIRRNRTVANGVVGESTPKTDSSKAQVVLDSQTVAALERHRQRRSALIEQQVADDDYVICAASGGGLDPNNLGRSFRRLLDAYEGAGIRPILPRGLSLHCLRHSFATNLVTAGTNLKIAAEAMRHSDTRMMDRYAHLTRSTVADAVRSRAAGIAT